jgi:hypothetical protein
MIKKGITRFILIGENVLNFHAGDDLYYEEWYDDIKDEDGWIVALNFRDHVVDEMRRVRLHYYINLGEAYNDFLWRKFKPDDLVEAVENLLIKSLK